MRRIATLAMFLIALVCATTSALAQFETASVLGYIRDASGAVIPNATVTLTNQETKAQVVSKTNDQGAYQFTDVKIGQYQVAAQASWLRQRHHAELYRCRQRPSACRPRYEGGIEHGDGHG